MPAKQHIFTEVEIIDLLNDAEEVSSRAWRHGRQVTYVVPYGNEHYLVTLNVHHEEGIQLCGDVTGTLAIQRTRTVTEWVAAP